MKNKIKYLCALVLASILFQSGIAYASDDLSSPFKPEAYGIDTIAGFPASIRSSKTLADKTVIFSVKKPDGTVLSIPVESNDNGIAKFDLYDYHTKKAGEYTVSAKLENGKEGDTNTFTVFPDEASPSGSEVEVSKMLATADGLDKVYLTVNLQDKHGNPVKGHSVEVVSSRAKDEITRISNKSFTNDNGSMIFSVSSKEKGVSVYSFLDTTSGITLDERIEIAYKQLEDVGGFIPTAYAQAGEVSTFEFENIPSDISPNSDVSFTLNAVDAEGDIVPNYAGTVHFSAEGANSVYASLPNDYTYDIDLDAGSHEFSGVNALNFSQAGTYTIVATDLADFTIRGQTEITVGQATQQPGDETPGQPAAAEDEIVITSPSPGTYSNSQIPILGSSPSQAWTIQIFDNDQNIGQTDVSSDNTFRFEPAVLEEGQHTVFAVGLDEDGTIQSTSEEVTFTVDTTPPEVDDISFSPSTGINTGEVIDITVISEPNLFQGAVVFNVDIAELEQDPADSTKYIASIQAPQEAGEYPVDVILVDELGNEGTYEGVATVEVTDDGEATISDGEEPPVDEEPVTPPAETNQPPSDVFGLRATSSNERVTLTWEPATDDAAIDHYRVYYGLNPNNLDTVVNTFDNNNTWYIPNLQNGNEYFFAVTAIDTDGLESENRSSIVSAIPFSPAPVFIAPEEPVEPEPQRPTAPRMQATGPEVLWFLLFSLAMSQVYFKFKKNVC
jgi:hypothetical protein